MSEGIFERISPLKVFLATEFPKEFTWLNTKEPLSIASLRGNIIVLDFWTYCCINCIHMAEELKKVEERYRDKPVVVIGVHSAKFANEQDSRNIESAIERYGISHPVIVDESMRIWKDYGAQGWPTIVIVDPVGRIVYRRSGEGQIESISKAIDKLLEKHSRDNTLSERRATVKPAMRSTSDRLYFPGKICFSPDRKSIAISDSNNDRIVIAEIATGGVVKTIGGSRGLKDGALDKSSFSKPQGVIWPDANTLYVADTNNHAIRKVDLGTGVVSTIAGTGNESNWLALGGDALNIGLNSPWDLAYLNGEIYVAMAGTHQIWSYNITAGKITPFLGSGFEGIEDGKGMGSLLAQPSGLSLSNGYLYIADSEVSAIRRAEISSKRIETLVGRGLFKFGYKDGKLKEAEFQHPIGVCADGNAVYVADTYNHAIRMIDMEKRTVATLVGSRDNPGVCRFDDPHCDVLGLYEPNDVKIKNGKLYIADTNNHLIRIFDLETKMLSTLNVNLKGQES